MISAIRAVCRVEFRLSPWSVLFSISVIKSVFEYCAKRSVSSGGGSSGGFLGALLALGLGAVLDAGVGSAFGLALGFTLGGTRLFGTGGGGSSAGSSGTGSWDS